MCKICSKLTIEILERRLFGVIFINFENISHIVQVFPLLALKWEWEFFFGHITCSKLQVKLLDYRAKYLVENI